MSSNNVTNKARIYSLSAQRTDNLSHLLGSGLSGCPLLEGGVAGINNPAGVRPNPADDVGGPPKVEVGVRRSDEGLLLYTELAWWWCGFLMGVEQGVILTPDPILVGVVRHDKDALVGVVRLDWHREGGLVGVVREDKGALVGVVRQDKGNGLVGVVRAEDSRDPLDDGALLPAGEELLL